MNADISPDSIDGGFRPRRREAVASVVLDGEAVLFDGTNGHSHLLNPIASIVWQTLDGEASIDELVDELADLYRADRTTIRADVLTLTQELGRQGLLHGVAGEAQAPETPNETDDECAG